jgi:hypothetical protein
MTSSKEAMMGDATDTEQAVGLLNAWQKQPDSFSRVWSVGRLSDGGCFVHLNCGLRTYSHIHPSSFLPAAEATVAAALGDPKPR